MRFVSRLRDAARSCEFENVDLEILSQMTTGTNNNTLQQHLILNDVRSLKDAIEKAKNIEDMNNQIKTLNVTKHQHNREQRKREHRKKTNEHELTT